MRETSRPDRARARHHAGERRHAERARPRGEARPGADLAARDATERALRESEERFGRFMQHLPGLAWIKDLQGRYVFANDAAVRTFGVPRDSLYGRTDEEVFPPEIAAQFTENDRRAVASAAGVQVVEVLEHGDGVLHHSIVSKFPILGPDGEPRWVGGTAFDITEHMRAQQALRDGEARLRAIFETAVDGIVTISEAGLIESVNPAVERLFGYPAGELVGRNVNVLMPEPYRGEHDSNLENYRRTGERRIIGIGREVLGQRRDGTQFPMDLTVSELSLGGQRMFTALVRDVTERKRAEEGLREADRRKTEFLATLSHELRNPLAPIRNSLEILKRAGTDPELLRQGRETIERQVAHMVRLVDDLLDVSRITRDRLELRRTRVALAPVIQHAIETWRPLAEDKGQRIEVALPERPVHLDGDPVRLAQVLSNLLNNACKYTASGGTIRVAAERRGAWVTVSVTDSGIGIPPEKLASIFEMFTQLDTAPDRSGTGLGIGLTLAKRLVELHGGTIEARSPGPAKGSEFVIRLPALLEQGKEEAAPAAAPVGRAWTPLRVLVVDDNEDSAASLTTLLCLGGHETRVAHDGVETVQVAGQFHPDVVLLDIGLPKLSGLDACRLIREQPWGRDMAIVALTGWGQDEDRERSRYAGFDAHLVKPVDHDTLTGLLGRLAGPRDRRPSA
jgi:PAS domain S-box-containing protein